MSHPKTEPRAEEAKNGVTLACLECGKTLHVKEVGRVPKFCCRQHQARYNAKARRRRSGGRAGVIAKHVAQQQHERDKEPQPPAQKGQAAAVVERALATNSLEGPGQAEAVVVTKATLKIEETAVRYPGRGHREGGR